MPLPTVQITLTHDNGEPEAVLALLNTGWKCFVPTKFGDLKPGKIPARFLRVMKANERSAA